MTDFYIGPNPTALRIVSGHSLSPDNDTVTTSPSLTEGPDRGNTRMGKAQRVAVRSPEGGVM
jgi:hypothetical protein